MPAPGRLLVVAYVALVLAGCGDDGDNDVSGQQRCGDLTLSRQSGERAFDVTTENVSCEEARDLLRSDSELQDWNCDVIARGPGQQTTRCSEGKRVIVFVTDT